jgi:2'-5' RNA ligase
MDNNEIRTFIAIELPPEIKADLHTLIDGFKKPGQPLKWVNPENIHLTIKFLGNVKQGRVQEITGALQKAVNGLSGFTLKMSDLGFFPNARRPRVFWVGVGGDIKSLILLQGRVDDNIEKLGFEREKRPFSPHLTLARVNDSGLSGRLGEFVQSAGKTSYTGKVPIEVKSICLMRSELSRIGAVYTRLSEIALPV